MPRASCILERLSSSPKPGNERTHDDPRAQMFADMRGAFRFRISHLGRCVWMAGSCAVQKEKSYPRFLPNVMCRAAPTDPMHNFEVLVSCAQETNSLMKLRKMG